MTKIKPITRGLRSDVERQAAARRSEWLDVNVVPVWLWQIARIDPCYVAMVLSEKLGGEPIDYPTAIAQIAARLNMVPEYSVEDFAYVDDRFYLNASGEQWTRANVQSALGQRGCLHVVERDGGPNAIRRIKREEKTE